MSESKDELNKSISWGWLIVVLIMVLLLWSANYFILNDNSQKGVYGDMFGAVNALFSGFAFVGVIYAILLQRKELELQRIELAQTREELEGQKLEMRLQNKTLRKQAFENTFFQLLTLHTDITTSLKFNRSEGKEAFTELFHGLSNNWLVRGNVDELVKINLNYLEFYKVNSAYIGHYFRSLYNIFKFIDQSENEN
ncbi:MAG: hypothetical protein JJ895_12545 [Balneolaceae bacterium]|nr:hypothetical protein [Balneolaceae bacterium]